MAHTILHKVRGVALTRVVEETDILFSHRNPTALKSKGVPEGGPDMSLENKGMSSSMDNQYPVWELMAAQ